MVRKTRASMSESVLPIFEDEVLPEWMLQKRISRSHRETYEFPNNNLIVLGGMDNAKRVMSAQYDMVCMFEATEFTNEDYDNLNSRLRNYKMPYQQMVCDCNPDHPEHFLNLLGMQGKITRILTTHRDNPVYFDDDGRPTDKGLDYLAGLRNLSGARRARLYEGKWVAAEGLVYNEFDKDIHVINEYTDPIKEFRVGVDWGKRDPGVFQIWGIDYYARSVLFEEIYRHDEDFDWWRSRAKLIQKKYAPRRWVCDHSPEKISMLRRIGIPAVKAKKDIQMGIQIVQARLKLQDDSRPMIYLLRDALGKTDHKLKESGLPCRTQDEFWSYTYEDARDRKNYKEIPRDYCNHGMDAMRYVQVDIDKYFRRRLLLN